MTQAVPMVLTLLPGYFPLQGRVSLPPPGGDMQAAVPLHSSSHSSTTIYGASSFAKHGDTAAQNGGIRG